MFSMFRFLMEDKSVVCRIIRLLILILTIYLHDVADTKVMSEFLHRDGDRYWVTVDGVRQLYRRIECKMCFEVIEKLKKL
jgi:hypothetical protein